MTGHVLAMCSHPCYCVRPLVIVTYYCFLPHVIVTCYCVLPSVIVKCYCFPQCYCDMLSVSPIQLSAPATINPFLETVTYVKFRYRLRGDGYLRCVKTNERP